MSVLRSKDNPRVKRWARLAAEARYRRSERRFIAEGPHLVETAVSSGAKPLAILATEAGLANSEIAALVRKAGAAPVVVSAAVLKCIVGSETPQGIAAELEIPRFASDLEGSTIFLEGVQDAGNVGTILRSAAAFGVRAAVLDEGCADAWSPKVVRAGAGAHFCLAIRQARTLVEELAQFKGKLVATVAHGGVPLVEADLSGPMGWIFGTEGQGVSSELQQRADLRVRIPMASGMESLNVAAAAAICFYQASVNRPGAGS